MVAHNRHYWKGKATKWSGYSMKNNKNNKNFCFMTFLRNVIHQSEVVLWIMFGQNFFISIEFVVEKMWRFPEKVYFLTNDEHHKILVFAFVNFGSGANQRSLNCVQCKENASKHGCHVTKYFFINSMSLTMKQPTVKLWINHTKSKWDFFLVVFDFTHAVQCSSCHTRFKCAIIRNWFMYWYIGIAYAFLHFAFKFLRSVTNERTRLKAIKSH